MEIPLDLHIEFYTEHHIVCLNHAYLLMQHFVTVNVRIENYKEDGRWLQEPCHFCLAGELATGLGYYKDRNYKQRELRIDKSEISNTDLKFCSLFAHAKQNGCTR